MSTPGKEEEFRPDWEAVRFVHLGGGCRAFNGLNEKVELQPATTGDKVATISTPSYHQLFNILRKVRATVIGCDFIFDQDELAGHKLPRWRSYHLMGESIWPCRDQADIWSFIGHAALKAGLGNLWDVASRISHQLQVCDWRIRQLSDCYRAVLTECMRSKTYQDGRRFDNQRVWLSYLAFQSYVVDACVLRDYLAEYYALKLRLDKNPACSDKITTMKGLKGKYLDKVTSPTLPEKAMIEATGEGGWLKDLTAYRNLVVHVAPLASADKHLYALCKPFKLDRDNSLPSIKLPIPSDPLSISESRNSGKHFEDPEMNYARFLNSLEKPEHALDALEHAHRSLGHLSWLAWHLSATSPVKPEMPELTEADIISIERVDECGNVLPD